MLMEENDKQQSKQIPKRIWYIAAAVLLCAVIYVFVSADIEAGKAVAETAVPVLVQETTATPAPTLIPIGKTLAVVLDELEQQGYLITETDAAQHRYTICAQGYVPIDVVFSLNYRFVTAFSLQFVPMPVLPDSNVIEAYLDEDATIRQYEHLSLLLPALINAADLENRLDYPTKLLWVELAEDAMRNDDPVTDKQNGCTFSAFHRIDGDFLLSVSFS